MSDSVIDERGLRMLDLMRKRTYCSLDYLADSLDVSTRTIRNSVKQLNQDLKGLAVLENEKGKGIRLVVKNEQLYEELLERVLLTRNVQDSPQRRIAFIVDRLLNDDEVNTLDDLSYAMNIGKTTLVNELKKATVALETYNLSIRGRQNDGMYLNGNELDLRFFILDNVYDYIYMDYPIDEDIKEAIKLVANQYDLDIATVNRLMQSVIVMLDRFVKGYQLREVNSKFEKLINSNDYQIALQIKIAIEKQLPVQLPEAEILFITLPIAGRRTPTNNRTMADMKITDDIINLLERIIEHVGLEKNVIHENDLFYKDLLYHLTFMLNRLMFGIRIKNPLLADVIEKYPVAYKMSEIAGQVIEREYDVKVSEDELGYIAFYFGVFIAQNEVNTKRLKQVAVVCGTGRGTAKLVSIQLQRVLGQDTIIDLFSETEVLKQTLELYDLVFTTVKLPFVMDTPMLLISEIFDERSISRQIEKLTYLNKFNLKDSGNHNSIIKLLTNEEKFFKLDRFKSYHENLEDMIDVLVEAGYLDYQFKERLRDREKKGSMIFDRYIALPHTLNTASNKIELAVGIYPGIYVEDGKEIKLVFLLGIPEQADHDASLLVKIYDEIIKIAASDNIVNKLIASDNYTEFSNCLEHAFRL